MAKTLSIMTTGISPASPTRMRADVCEGCTGTGKKIARLIVSGGANTFDDILNKHKVTTHLLS
jgi:hypothetical protein